jgi:hypothetical protein
VACAGGDLDGETGGAQIEAGQQLQGEVDSVVGDVGVAVREGEGALGLGDGSPTTESRMRNHAAMAAQGDEGGRLAPVRLASAAETQES